MMKRGTFLGVTLATLLALAPGAGAQTTGAAVAGVVHTQNGEVVAGAKVTVSSAATNQARTAVTDGEGSYRLPSLAVGTYEITVEAEGYSKIIRRQTLRVNEEARIDFELVLEGLEESVSVVTGSAPLTEAGTSVLGGIIENKQINEFPLNGRNFLQLGMLVANVNSTASIRSAAEGGINNGPFAISGQRDRALTFLVDGLDSGNSLKVGLPAQISLDTIQEFKMITSLGSAEFGHHSGGQVNIVTKSGTNEFHAGAFGFFRHERLSARNYFERLAGRPTSRFANAQFGATVGGPVVRDRTFFLANYEGQRLRAGSLQFAQVPTEAERRGLFLNTFTGRTVQVPVDPLAAEILRRYVPLPNTQNQFGNYLSTPAVKRVDDFALVRVDHLVSGDGVFNARYFFSDNRTFHPIVRDINRFYRSTPSSLTGFGEDERSRNQNLALSYTHSFSAQAINELRFGYNRISLLETSENRSRPADLGFTGSEGTSGLYTMVAPGMSQLGSVLHHPEKMKASNFHVWDSFTFSRGRHALKLGGEARLINQSQSLFQGGSGMLFFSGGFSGISPVADFVMGAPTFAMAFSRSYGSPMRQTGAGLYVQDNYQVNSRLVLNLGLRYELNSVLESPTHQLTNFSLARGYFTPGVDTDAGLYRGDHNNFAPRAGFALSLTADGRTVVRGGYGIYFDAIVHSLAPMLNTQHAASPPWFQISLAPMGPGRMRDSFNPAFLFGLRGDVYSYDEGLRTPYAQHFNLNMQREVGKNLLLSLGYVGTKSTKLLRVRDINQALYLPGTDAQGKPLSTFDPRNLLARRPTQLFRLTPFPVGSVQQAETASNAIYHAFQATLNKRLSDGWSVLSTYTWSKSIDDAADPLGYAGDAGVPQNSYDLSQERALSAFDIRHRLSIGFTYELPFRKRGWTEGWQVNGVVRLQSGQPFTPAPDFDMSLTGSLNPRPNHLPGALISEGGQVRLNPSLPLDPFTRLPRGLLPAPGEFGNLGRNTFIGPGYKQVDISVNKTIRLGEKLRAQTRLEVFNLFNTTNLALPVRRLSDPFFGRSVNTQDVAGGVPGIGGGGPRAFQAAIRFDF